MSIEFGIASPANPYIEPLGGISRRQAETILADSKKAWPDVYLVTRASSGEWTPADTEGAS